MVKTARCPRCNNLAKHFQATTYICSSCGKTFAHKEQAESRKLTAEEEAAKRAKGENS